MRYPLNCGRIMTGLIVALHKQRGYDSMFACCNRFTKIIIPRNDLQNDWSKPLASIKFAFNARTGPQEFICLLLYGFKPTLKIRSGSSFTYTCQILNDWSNLCISIPFTGPNRSEAVSLFIHLLRFDPHSDSITPPLWKLRQQTTRSRR